MANFEINYLHNTADPPIAGDIIFKIPPSGATVGFFEYFCGGEIFLEGFKLGLYAAIDISKFGICGVIWLTLRLIISIIRPILLLQGT